MSNWVFIKGENELKSHVVPGHIAQEIAADLTARGMQCSITDTEPLFMFDGVPGVVYSDRPKLSLCLLGLSVQVICENIKSTLASLQAAPMRATPNGRSYIKFHDLYRCLVLTPMQRDTFVSQLQKHVDECEVLACEFYAHKKALNVVLAEAARKSTGAVLPPEAVGTDPHKRYRTPAGVN